MSAASLHDRSKVNCTSGTSALSACDEAASVVTARFDRGTTTRCLRGAARLVLKALLNMIDDVGSYQIKSKFGEMLNVGKLALKALVDFDAFLSLFRKPKRFEDFEDTATTPPSKINRQCTE